MVLTGKRFGAKHGFSTRQGGVSEGPFASLNLGRSVGDEPEHVDENGRRFARAVGLTAGQLVSANQVHGDAIIEVVGATPGDRMPQALGDADGLITRVRGAALCIRTADCVPVLLWAPDIDAIAAVHAGWRGAILSIGASAVRRLEAWGAAPGRVQAIIGPSIRRCCYEVSDELALRFTERFGPGVVMTGPVGRPHLDVAEASRLALLEVGVAEENIELMPQCTACDAERFFSHRRDQGRTGRHVSFVVL